MKGRGGISLFVPEMKKERIRQPKAPKARSDTVRHEIISVLSGREMTAREISGEVGISEKEVYQHLEHVRISLGAHGMALSVRPALCRKCGFEFKKREKLRKPGKCPVCKSESIEVPLFSVAQKPGASSRSS